MSLDGGREKREQNGECVRRTKREDACERNTKIENAQVARRTRMVDAGKVPPLQKCATMPLLTRNLRQNSPSLVSELVISSGKMLARSLFHREGRRRRLHAIWLTFPYRDCTANCAARPTKERQSTDLPHTGRFDRSPIKAHYIIKDKYSHNSLIKSLPPLLVIFILLKKMYPFLIVQINNTFTFIVLTSK